MKLIDFEKEEPFFVNGAIRWYLDKYFQQYINNQQAENLPKLEDIAVFVVCANNGIEQIRDYVIVDNNQNIVATYNYPHDFEQVEAKLNMLKLLKHFDNGEQDDI